MDSYADDRPRAEMQIGTAKALIAGICEQLGRRAACCPVWLSDDEAKPARLNCTAADMLDGLDQIPDHIDCVMTDGDYHDPVVRIGTYRRGLLIVIDPMLGYSESPDPDSTEDCA